MILQVWLLPNPTVPPSFIVRVRNIYFSPVMCHEQPLSRYHDLWSSFTLRHISFSSLESVSGSASEVTIATNRTATFASSPASSLSNPYSLSKSSQVAIRLCLICLLYFLDLKVGFLDFSFDFSFWRSGQSAMKYPSFLQLNQPF